MFEEAVYSRAEDDIDPFSICVLITRGGLGREVTFNISSRADSDPMTADGELISNDHDWTKQHLL